MVCHSADHVRFRRGPFWVYFSRKLLASGENIQLGSAAHSRYHSHWGFGGYSTYHTARLFTTSCPTSKSIALVIYASHITLKLIALLYHALLLIGMVFIRLTRPCVNREHPQTIYTKLLSKQPRRDRKWIVVSPAHHGLTPF